MGEQGLAPLRGSQQEQAGNDSVAAFLLAAWLRCEACYPSDTAVSPWSVRPEVKQAAFFHGVTFALLNLPIQGRTEANEFKGMRNPIGRNRDYAGYVARVTQAVPGSSQ